MKTITIFLILLLAAGLLGCGKQPEPRHIVILPDISGSIDRQALEQAFKAIDDIAGHLQRGDWITVIPILGDAQAEASGRIIRFEVPITRQAYDADLINFQARLKKGLEDLETNALSHPGSETDILGTLELAEQEFYNRRWRSKMVLVILSDFIQEAQGLDFRMDKRLIDSVGMRRLSATLNATTRIKLDGISVYLGLLRSTEYLHLDQLRRNAIKTFWIHYLRGAGADPHFITDGIGLLRLYISGGEIM